MKKEEGEIKKLKREANLKIEKAFVGKAFRYKKYDDGCVPNRRNYRTNTNTGLFYEPTDMSPACRGQAGSGYGSVFRGDTFIKILRYYPNDRQFLVISFHSLLNDAIDQGASHGDLLVNGSLIALAKFEYKKINEENIEASYDAVTEAEFNEALKEAQGDIATVLEFEKPKK